MRLWLLKLRKAKGLTQQKVADLADISRVHYTTIEAGKRNPSVKMAKKIAPIIGCEWTDFFDKNCSVLENGVENKKGD